MRERLLILGSWIRDPAFKGKHLFPFFANCQFFQKWRPAWLRAQGVSPWEPVAVLGFVRKSQVTTLHAVDDPSHMQTSRNGFDMSLCLVASQGASQQLSSGPSDFAAKSLIAVVGATGIEPVTPTMSR